MKSTSNQTCFHENGQINKSFLEFSKCIFRINGKRQLFSYIFIFLERKIVQKLQLEIRKRDFLHMSQSFVLGSYLLVVFLSLLKWRRVCLWNDCAVPAHGGGIIPFCGRTPSSHFAITPSTRLRWFSYITNLKTCVPKWVCLSWKPVLREG